MKKKTGQILLRIIGGILFLMLPIFSSPDYGMDIIANLSNPQGLKDFFVYVLLLAFFLVHIQFIIPKLFFRKKYIVYGGFVVLCFCVIVFTPNILLVSEYKVPPSPPYEMENDNNTYRFDKDEPPPPPQYKNSLRPPMPSRHEPMKGNSFLLEIGRYLPMFLVLLFVSLAIQVNSRWRVVEQEKTNAELSYLKAQINPHFLFNTLNSIYALAIIKSDETPKAVTQLSEMMRYVLNEPNKDFVPLEKEINYISNYIELQKMRFGDTIHLKYTFLGKPNGQLIAPLILITFIENAFKHGIDPEEESRIVISIEIINGDVVLMVDNKKVSTSKGDNNLKSGLGIENARQRLHLLYPQKYDLTIADEETDYLICLKINLK